MKIHYRKVKVHVYIQRSNLISAAVMAFIAFTVALMMSIGSEALVRAMNSIIIALLLLFVIIFLGIFFDTIGTAFAAATLPPFNAKAAKKVFGAKQAVKLIRNADLVANFCNDVVGDIAGTLSGAIGAGIVVSLSHQFKVLDLVLAGAVMTSAIAAFTVGGKALGKYVALNNTNNIIEHVARAVAWWENTTGIELLKNRR